MCKLNFQKGIPFHLDSVICNHSFLAIAWKSMFPLVDVLIFPHCCNKILQAGCIKQQKFGSHCSGGSNPRSRQECDLISGEGSPLGLQTDVFYLLFIAQRLKYMPSLSLLMASALIISMDYIFTDTASYNSISQRSISK